MAMSFAVSASTSRIANRSSRGRIDLKNSVNSASFTPWPFLSGIWGPPLH